MTDLHALPPTPTPSPLLPCSRPPTHPPNSSPPLPPAPRKTTMQKTLEQDDQPEYVSVLKNAIADAREKERRKRRGGPILLAGLCVPPKALAPLLPIYLQGVLQVPGDGGRGRVGGVWGGVCVPYAWGVREARGKGALLRPCQVFSCTQRLHTCVTPTQTSLLPALPPPSPSLRPPCGGPAGQQR